jgi:hypothetical protein
METFSHATQLFLVSFTAFKAVNLQAVGDEGHLRFQGRRETTSFLVQTCTQIPKRQHCAVSVSFQGVLGMCPLARSPSRV